MPSVASDDRPLSAGDGDRRSSTPRRTARPVDLGEPFGTLRAVAERPSAEADWRMTHGSSGVESSAAAARAASGAYALAASPRRTASRIASLPRLRALATVRVRTGGRAGVAARRRAMPRRGACQRGRRRLLARRHAARRRLASLAGGAAGSTTPRRPGCASTRPAASSRTSGRPGWSSGRAPWSPRARSTWRASPTPARSWRSGPPLSLFRDADGPERPVRLPARRAEHGGVGWQHLRDVAGLVRAVLQPGAAVQPDARPRLARRDLPVPDAVPRMVAGRADRCGRLGRLQVHLGGRRGRHAAPGPRA